MKFHSNKLEESSDDDEDDEDDDFTFERVELEVESNVESSEDEEVEDEISFATQSSDDGKPIMAQSTENETTKKKNDWKYRKKKKKKKVQDELNDEIVDFEVVSVSNGNNLMSDVAKGVKSDVKGGVKSDIKGIKSDIKGGIESDVKGIKSEVRGIKEYSCLTLDEKNLFKDFYQTKPYPERQDVKRLAELTGRPEKKVAKWFEHRRKADGVSGMRGEASEDVRRKLELIRKSQSVKKQSRSQKSSLKSQASRDSDGNSDARPILDIRNSDDNDDKMKSQHSIKKPSDKKESRSRKSSLRSQTSGDSDGNSDARPSLDARISSDVHNSDNNDGNNKTNSKKGRPFGAQDSFKDRPRQMLLEVYRSGTIYPGRDRVRELSRETGMEKKKILHFFKHRRKRDGLTNTREKKSVKRQAVSSENNVVDSDFSVKLDTESVKNEEESSSSDKNDLMDSNSGAEDGFKLDAADADADALQIGSVVGFRCFVCKYSTSCRNNLHRHFRKRHSVNPKVCKRCRGVYRKHDFRSHACRFRKASSANLAPNVESLPPNLKSDSDARLKPDLKSKRRFQKMLDALNVGTSNEVVMVSGEQFRAVQQFFEGEATVNLKKILKIIKNV